MRRPAAHLSSTARSSKDKMMASETLNGRYHKDSVFISQAIYETQHEKVSSRASPIFLSLF